MKPECDGGALRDHTLLPSYICPVVLVRMPLSALHTQNYICALKVMCSFREEGGIFSVMSFTTTKKSSSHYMSWLLWLYSMPQEFIDSLLTENGQHLYSAFWVLAAFSSTSQHKSAFTHSHTHTHTHARTGTHTHSCTDAKGYHARGHLLIWLINIHTCALTHSICQQLGAVSRVQCFTQKHLDMLFRDLSWMSARPPEQQLL